MQKATIGIIVIILVVAGLWFLMSNQKGSPVLETATTTSEMPATESGAAVEIDVVAGTNPAKATVVKVTEAGFSPQTVTIKKGETVRFDNESGAPSWPASAVHPTHAVYPEKSSADCLGSSFDACRNIPSGESWSFTFNVVGEWKYHDHVKTGRFGTVVVTE